MRLQDKLILNYELIQRGATEDTLLDTGDPEDYGRPASFWLEVNADNILGYYRRLTGDDEITLQSVVCDILEFREYFKEDPKGFISALSSYIQTGKTANACKKSSVSSKEANSTPQH